MQYGVYVPNFGPYGDARVLADLAYEAEGAGWDGFFLWDQGSKSTLTPTVDPMVDPWVALAAIPLRTRTIRLGTLVTPLPRRRPWMVARGTVSLGPLSPGRLILSVCSGGGHVAREAALAPRGPLGRRHPHRARPAPHRDAHPGADARNRPLCRIPARIHDPVRGRPFGYHRRHGRSPRSRGRCRLPAGGSHMVGGKDPARTLGKLVRLAP